MATVNIAYGSSAAITNAIASLASDTNLLAGYESAILDNTSNKYTDYLVGGQVTTGTSPTAAKTIEVWAVGALDDTPTWPDVFDGTTSAETVTSRDILFGFAKLVASLTTDATSNRVYYFGPVSLAALFGGSVPKKDRKSVV